MPGFSLRPNLVFSWHAVAYRIERMLPNAKVLLERRDDGDVITVHQEELLAEYSAGRIAAEPYATSGDQVPAYSRPMRELPEKLRMEVRRRLAYLEALEADGSPMFTPEYVLPTVQQVAAQLDDPRPPSATTLYRWYRRYRQAGDTTSLVPRFDRRGSRLLRQDDRLIQLATEAMEEAFKASPRAGTQDVFMRLKGKVERENANLIGTSKLRMPSLRTVYRLLARTEAQEMFNLRQGKSMTDRRFRINKAGTSTSYILERVEVDHTPLDLFLICEKSFLPFGRPTLTCLIDHYSRMPLGYYLSFAGPSAAAVMGALRHAILPKTRTEAVVSGLSIEHLWPCYGVMDQLVVDNGLEFHGKDLESVAQDLGIRLLYCPKHAPQFKGTIERFLKTINYFFVHQLPGTSMARLQERGDYDPSKHALLTMAEFKCVLEKWFLDIYAQTIHRGLGVTPWAKWQEGAAHRTLVLPESVQSLQRRIGLVTERRLRRDGIWLNNLRYSGEALAPMLRKYGEGVRVRVLHDHEDLGEVQVWAPDSDDPVTVPALDYDYAKGLTAYQHELVCEKLREEGARTEDRHARDRAKYELALAIEALMTSRKLRDRRKAGRVLGLTSTRPAEPPPSMQQKKPRHPVIAPNMHADELPPILPSFRLGKRGGAHG